MTTPPRIDLPRLGLGTWEMGFDSARRKHEVAALRLGIELGLTLVDTAEMYAAGGAERVVGEALDGLRDRVTLVSKVLPENASRRGTIRAAERSLERLRTDVLDLYLLHWPSDHPLDGTIEAFEELRAAGKIRAWGVSNFDVPLLEVGEALAAGGEMTANQILYNLASRRSERRVIPWCRERGIVVMAYSPLGQGRLQIRPALREVAAARDLAPQAVALAWTLREPGVVTIVKAANLDHLRADAGAAELELTPAELATLDRAYPRPTRDGPLETL